MTSYELVQLTTQRPDTDGSFPFFLFSFRDERQKSVAFAHSTFTTHMTMHPAMGNGYMLLIGLGELGSCLCPCFAPFLLFLSCFHLLSGLWDNLWCFLLSDNSIRSLSLGVLFFFSFLIIFPPYDSTCTSWIQ